MKFSNRGKTGNNAARLCEPHRQPPPDFFVWTRKDTTPPLFVAYRAAQGFARRHFKIKNKKIKIYLLIYIYIFIYFIKFRNIVPIFERLHLMIAKPTLDDCKDYI